MSMKLLGVAKFTFKISCFITVLCMISLWVSRFMKDEDLCIVEYKSFGNAEDIELPEASLCVQDPFVEHKLNVLGITTATYREHLAGKGFNESLTNINYTDVIFDFGRFYRRTFLRYRNGTYGNLVGGALTARLSGFYYGHFLMCYGFDVNHSEMDDVKYAIHYLIRAPVLQDFNSPRGIIAMIHGPKQIMLTTNARDVSFDINGTYGGNIAIDITKVEVFKRRNKPKDPCVMQWRNWNELAISKHIVDIGCVPPYLEKHQNMTICSTPSELIRWYKSIDITKNQHDYLPCQQMPGIAYNLMSLDKLHKEELIQIAVEYPEQVKIISQSRAVNIDSLIGNIGGYIGLFLGLLYETVA